MRPGTPNPLEVVRHALLGAKAKPGAAPCHSPSLRSGLLWVRTSMPPELPGHRGHHGPSRGAGGGPSPGWGCSCLACPLGTMKALEAVVTRAEMRSTSGNGTSSTRSR